MKKLFFLTALLCASVMSWADDPVPYCDEPLTLSGGAEIQLSCIKVSDGNYQIVIKGTNLNGLGGSFYNPGAVDLRTKITTNTSTLIVCDIEAESAPTLYTPLYVMCPGEQNIGWPDDVEWGTCDEPEECTDKTAPTVTAVATSATYNSATLTITAADNDGGSGIKRYIVKKGDDQLASSSSNVITLTGLSSNTEYSLKVFAKDGCDNLSSAFDVNFTTESISYCDYPTGHLGDAAFGDHNGRILLTIRKISANSVGVTVKPNNEGADVFDFVSVIVNGVGKDLGSVGGSTPTNTEIEFTGLASLSFPINILWHHSTWGDVNGRWTTNQFNVAEAELCLESPATAIGNTNANANAIKVIENGQLIIIKNGVKYNVIGTQL